MFRVIQGLLRARERAQGVPPYPPKVSEGMAGCPFSTPLYSEYSAVRIIIEERRAWDEEIRVFHNR